MLLVEITLGRASMVIAFVTLRKINRSKLRVQKGILTCTTTTVPNLTIISDINVRKTSKILVG
ncbi:hypothetical protein C5167_049250 [Papaver somniferum]|uniref:Uncharacterized protein n=1 Tax=Papaver somniferum TaxID=3469 RepID=A0A4Y7KN56_PAPSO|nr:hypothetical protein C5167_049250 [Papaver somniferum]